jgi:archaellum component FlaF (FlaF/FlaG flagellin family)
MEVDLTNSELFKSFTEFEKNGVYIDLHNEFDCQSIKYSSDLKQIMLSFTPNGHCTRNVKTVEVIFNDCSIERYSSKFDNQMQDQVQLTLCTEAVLE